MKDMLAILANAVLMLTYPILRHRRPMVRYSFSYGDLRFLCPGGFYGMLGLASSEPSVKNVLEVERSGDAIDVGANIGFYSILLSRFTGRVIAVEPDPFYFEYLLTNISVNGCTNVIPFRMAAWSAEEDLNLIRPLSGVPLDSHVMKGDAADNPSAKVRARTLDALARETGCHPSIVKIDAEGAEAEVLLGMQRVMTLDRPVIVFEARKETIHKCQEILSQKGFEVSMMPDGNYLAQPKRE